MGDDLFENLRMELRRGSVMVRLGEHPGGCVIDGGVVYRTEHYGYALRKALEEQGLPVDEDTLYPLLRRLESQGLLVSEWREEDRRRKRFYRISRQGQALLDRLLAEWRDINAALKRIL